MRPPEFYFELELRRIAAELHPGVSAKPPAKGAEGGRDYDAQRDEADAADFRDALGKKRIAPPDAAQAEAAHTAARDVIDATSKENDPRKPLPAEFASEFADYHRGALAFRREDFDAAKAAWTALLARPAAERHYRTTWAAYMLGRLAIDAEAWDAAREWFAKVRAAVKDGFADSLGLASASLGWEAYADLHSERFADAARLYLEQLASGDGSAVNSLRTVMEEVFKDGADLATLARDPALQRVGIAGAVAEMTPFVGAFGDEPREDLTTRWLKALESIDAKNVRDAGRVAWIAYARGQYANAQRWLARADSEAPYALWLRAKFALRDGKLDAATKLLARAVEKLPPERRVESYSIFPSSIPPRDVAHGELGLLRLSRAEFIAALRLFLEGGLYSDAFYVADGVLTLDELKAFIAGEAGKLPKVREYSWEPPDEEQAKAEATKPDPPWHFYYYADPAAELRHILARRYVRAGRYAEARPLLDEEARKQLDDYAALLDRAKAKETGRLEKAEALWSAAKLMQQHGDALADYFDPVTIAQRATGREVETGSYPEFFLKYGKPDRFVPPLAKKEQQRLEANTKPKLRRHYSAFIAADLAWQAAALMPDDDEKTASRLNRAGSWIKEGDDKAADRFYQAIERRCAKTELGQRVIAKRWFVPVEDDDEKN